MVIARKENKNSFCRRRWWQLSAYLYLMDLPLTTHHKEFEENWKDIPFDFWTTASIGDVEHLKYLTNNSTVYRYSTIQEEGQLELQQCKPILNLDTKNTGGWTCLMYASYYNHADIARWLLRGNGSEDMYMFQRLPVDPYMKNNKQRNALMLAASCGNNETVEAILDSLNEQYHGENIGVVFRSS